MIRRYLGDYQGFVCIADKCPDTCCGGWEIEIDEESLDMYRFLAQDHKVFADNIDYEECCFKQKANGDCACLREDRLCIIQKDFGEEYLCPTCDLYPRHIEEFPGVREYSISLSCPAAAENFIEDQESLSFVEIEDDMEDLEEYEDFDENLYEMLLSSREQVLSILTDGSLSTEDAFNKMIDHVAKFQDKYDAGVLMGEIDEVGGDQPDSSNIYNNQSFENIFADGKGRQLIFDTLFVMDPLKEDFVQWMKDARTILGFDNANSEKGQGIISESFEELEQRFDMEISNSDILMRNIAIYFISTYFCGAVYDEYILAQAKLAVFSAHIIKYLWMAKYKENSYAISKKEMGQLLYKYCREIENCTENLLAVLRHLEENVFS